MGADRKNAIAEQARKLFNAKGVGAVSSRDIAEAMGIAYGNLTYHFPKKEDLVLHLYLDMMEAHRAVSAGFATAASGDDLLKAVILAPDATFAISLEYLFLFRDYAEILRDHPAAAALQRRTAAARKSGFHGLFAALRERKLFRADLDEADVDYLMDLSGAMRTFFFLERTPADFKPSRRAGLRREYVLYVNRLLYPYLTRKGAGIYRKTLSAVAV
jgi:AcrR family transcriptional regulator